ncbi:MAG: electron transfer flavoprotein subunit beta/FixA family protein [Candidatus Thalassarchaeaceae archaeon]|nr:electron transfer flavoprotein subunit beta/FixA family protein [Candidatus Thalassarchaeaceae archaeon]|tara:strand:- start:209 stop:967 length:759 start_codon:yes stop_codon:yes gene_type:complete
MTIAVLLKQVPDTTAKIAVSGGRVDQLSVSKWSTSPYDEYALEYALKLKEAGAGNLVAITCGPQRASKMLTDAAAVGADSMLHILADTSEMDSEQIQSILAAAIRHCEAEIVLCGKQAADTNSGSTGPGVASRIGAACVGMVSEVEVEGGSFSALRASSSGNERVSVSKPCLFTFDKAATELRRPNVKGIMMAKRKVIETVSPQDLGVEIGDSKVNIESQNSPPEKPPGQKFEGAESVPIVVLKLREEANVI